jgi:hypothetical protein
LSDLGHFETNSDACHCAYIGLILLQELTFWRSATKVGAGISCTFHAALIVVQFGSSDLAAPRRGRRQAKRNSLAGKLTIEENALGRLEGREGQVRRRQEGRGGRLGPARYLATLLGADNETVLRWFISRFALLLDPAAVLLLLAATRR